MLKSIVDHGDGRKVLVLGFTQPEVGSLRADPPQAFQANLFELLPSLRDMTDFGVTVFYAETDEALLTTFQALWGQELSPGSLDKLKAGQSFDLLWDNPPPPA